MQWSMKRREKERSMDRHPQKQQLWNVSVMLKNWYRLMAVRNMSANFNNLSIFAFCVYASRPSSTYAIGKF